MITAENKWWARMIFNPYEEILLKRTFSGFRLTGTLPKIHSDRSLIITPNHFSWWDGFFIDFVVRKLFSKKFHIIMLEEQLRKYSFFSKVGAFSIKPGSIRGIRESLGYSEKLLKEPGNLLVYYPQGSLEPYDKEEPTVRNGIFHLAKETGADVLPAAFRIEYQDQKKPAVYSRFGNVHTSNEISGDPDFFRRSFAENIRELNRCVKENRPAADLFERNPG